MAEYQSSQQPDAATLSRLISRDDSDALRFFFGCSGNVFAPSTTGILVDRLQLYAFGSLRCRACRGRGVVVLPCRRSEHRDAVRSYRASCRAQGVVPPKARGYPVSLHTESLCPECGGWGSIPRQGRTRQTAEITAQPIRSEQHYPSSGPGHEQMASLGRTQRLLTALNRSAPWAVDALEAYWGPAGEYTEHHRRGREGRLLAVYALVPAGLTLLRGLPTSERAEPHQALVGITDAQDQQQDPRRRTLMVKARDQAAELMVRASDQWADRAAEDARRNRGNADACRADAVALVAHAAAVTG